jgi:hypothetical protein
LDAKGNGIAGTGFGGAGSFAQSGLGTIAFGTIAGGVGASLSGGNFWQGAVTALVVSALNHAMHKIEEKQTVRGVLKRLGLNGGDKAPKTYASLRLLLSDPAMDGQYFWAGSPTVGDGGQMSINGKDNVRVNGSTASASTDIFGNGDIVMYGDSFKNWETLGFNMVHELHHRWQWSMGYIDRWMTKFNNNMDTVWNMAEYDAHTEVLHWGFKPGPGVLYLSPYSGAVNSQFPNTIK